MLTDAEKLKIFGGPAGVAAVDDYLDALVAAAPPMTNRQRDRLRALLRGPAEPVIPHQRRRAEPRNAKAA